jgi:hypothetical protein
VSVRNSVRTETSDGREYRQQKPRVPRPQSHPQVSWAARFSSMNSSSNDV